MLEPPPYPRRFTTVLYVTLCVLCVAIAGPITYLAIHPPTSAHLAKIAKPLHVAHNDHNHHLHLHPHPPQEGSAAFPLSMQLHPPHPPPPLPSQPTSILYSLKSTLQWSGTAAALAAAITLFSAIPIALAYRWVPLLPPPAYPPLHHASFDRLASLILHPFSMLVIPPFCAGAIVAAIFGAASTRPPEIPFGLGTLRTLERISIFLWLVMTLGFVCWAVAAVGVRILGWIERLQWREVES